jgi:hypothetical protein
LARITHSMKVWGQIIHILIQFPQSPLPGGCSCCHQQNTSNYLQDWQIQPNAHEQNTSDYLQDWQIQKGLCLFPSVSLCLLLHNFPLIFQPSWALADKQTKLPNLSGMRRPLGFKNSSEATTTPGRKRSAVPLQISTHRHSRHPNGDAVLQITQKRKHRKDPRPHALIWTSSGLRLRAWISYPRPACCHVNPLPIPPWPTATPTTQGDMIYSR